MDELLEAIKAISTKTGKPEPAIIAALSDYGILSFDQEMKLAEAASA